MSHILTEPPGRFLQAIGVAMLLSGFAWTAAAQDKANKQDGGQQPSAAASQQSASQQSADKKASQPSRYRGADKEAAKEPAKADPYGERDQSSQTNRNQAHSEDRGAAREAERDRFRPDRREDSRAPADANRQDRSREGDTPARDAARDADRSERTTRDTARDADRSERDSRDSSANGRRSQERTSVNFGITFADATNDGLVIDRLASRGIFARAKFREGDIVVSINGRRVRSQDDFFHWFHGTRDRVTVIVLRDDREVTLYVEPELLHEEPAPAHVTRGGAWLGVDLVDRFHNQAMVLKVHPNSPAERAGIRADDVILSVQGEEISSPDHLGQVIGRMRPGDEVEIEVDRDRRLRVMDAVLGQRGGTLQPATEAGPQLIPPQPEAGTVPPPPPQFREELPPPREGRQAPPREERRGLLRGLLPRR